MKIIPVGSLVGVNGSAAGDMLKDTADTFPFRPVNEGLSAPTALAQRDHNTALARLMFATTAIYTVFLLVGRADVTTKVGPIYFNISP